MTKVRTTSPRMFLAALVLATGWLGLTPPQAHAAVVAGVVFNNVSGSTALNADPSSSGDVDDVRVDDGDGLFLPSSASVEGLDGWLVFDNGSRAAFDSDDYTLAPAATDGEWVLTFERPDADVSIAVHKSDDVPAMYVTTGSGLAAIEADRDFEDTGAEMAMVDEAAGTLYNDALAEMKGRGNSTWTYPKKPYQIKLPTSTELVPSAGAHKTWILLANYLDQSLIRNELAYNLEGEALRLADSTDHSIKGRMIDLFIDGDFRGSYYLTEKVQVGANRVAITDLQKANEAANPDLGSQEPVVTTSFTEAPGIREAGYVPFTTTPAGYEQSGYLLEMDFASRAREERSYVITRHGTPFALKGPEDANAEEVAFVGNRLQQLEDAIYSPTGRNAAGVHFSELLDVPIWARYYLIQEMLANDDAFKSSTYLYMDNGGKLRAGPLWDADRTLGALRTAPDPARMHVADPARLKPRWILQLLAHETFRTAVQQAYTTVVAPAVDEVLAQDGSLTRYADEVDRSAALNKLRWAASEVSVAFGTPAGDIAHLRTYLEQRHAALGAVWRGSYTEGTMPPDGYYTIGNGALTVDVSSASFASKANIRLWSPNRTGAQTFRLQRGADSFYTITNANSTLAMDVQGGTAASSTNVWQYRANRTDAQKWRISTLDGRTYTIVSALDATSILDTGGPAVGYVLDAQGAGTTRGTNVQIYRPTGGTRQQFSLKQVQLPGPLADGGTYTVASVLDTTKVLDVAGGSPLKRANIQLWRANGTSAQRFTVNALSNGAVEFWTGTGANGVVDVAGGGTVSGTNVWQYSSNGTSAQQWVARPTGDLSGSFYVVSRHNGLYLEVKGASTTNGTNVWVYAGNGAPAQKFMFRQVG